MFVLSQGWNKDKNLTRTPPYWLVTSLPLAQRFEHPTGVRRIMGSISVRNSDFSVSVAHDTMNFSCFPFLLFLSFFLCQAIWKLVKRVYFSDFFLVYSKLTFKIPFKRDPNVVSVTGFQIRSVLCK